MADDNRRPPGADAVAAVDGDDFWSSPLPPSDWRAIQGWRPIDAAVLLLLSGLHVKLPPAEWRALLSRCGVTHPRAVAGDGGAARRQAAGTGWRWTWA